MAARGTEPGRIRPTRRLAVPIAGSLLLALLAVATDDIWLQLLAVLVAASILAGWVARPRPAGLRASVTGPGRVAAGATVVHVVEVRNDGPVTSPPVEVVHRSRLYGVATVFVPALPPGGRARAEVSRTALRRGIERHSELVARATAPFGLFSATLELPPAGPLVVHPRLGRSVPLQSQQRAGTAAGSAPSSPSTQPHSLREWRYGDPMRRVHWRSTARRGQLVVVEPERPSARDAVVLVVAYADAAAAAGAEDAIAGLAASVLRLRADGVEVVLLSTQPDLADLEGGTDLDVLDWFAGLRLDAMPDPAALQRALRRGVGGPGGVVAVVSPTARHWLRSVGAGTPPLPVVEFCDVTGG